jgi:leader peptidase (prepilin peptidase)/N-methyltransferase
MQIYDWLACLVTIAVCGISFYLFRYFIKNDNSENNIEFTKAAVVYSCVLTCLAVAITIVLRVLYTDTDLLFDIKRCVLLAVIWPVAYIDFKTYRIPNIFILEGLILRVVILVFEIIFEKDILLQTLLSDALACVIIVVTSMLCRLVIKNSIGFGDIKLFIVMSLFQGLDGIWGAVFMSLLVSFFVAVFLLATHRKNRKDVIPFGPAIISGTFLSVFLTGM